MNEFLQSMMYRDTLMNLSTGYVSDLDRDVLSRMHLPDSCVEPYASREMDPMETMQLTCRALASWIDASKKASYFSMHFVRLSKMIMNGVTTMGRGLVSLHARGEDLSLAPMSIDQLVSTASYQFRKSYLGMIQTVVSHPDVSERLLINQLGWSNILMRLYRTREKLSEKITVRPPDPVILEDPQIKTLPSAGTWPLRDPSPLSSPGAIAAPKAFRVMGDPSSTPRCHSARRQTPQLSPAGNDAAVNNNDSQENALPSAETTAAIIEENALPSAETTADAGKENPVPQTEVKSGTIENKGQSQFGMRNKSNAEFGMRNQSNAEFGMRNAEFFGTGNCSGP